MLVQKLTLSLWSIRPILPLCVDCVGTAGSCLLLLLNAQVGRNENIVGWYHSHPGYGCWLSGIDVMTQMTNQTFQDPFLAIVVRVFLHRLAVQSETSCKYAQIDPNRTVSAGRVEIGAFRTYPDVCSYQF